MYELTAKDEIRKTAKDFALSVILALIVGFLGGLFVGQYSTDSLPKPTFQFTVKQYADFTLDVLPSGEIIAIGLGNELADKYGCDYSYPSLVGHTCGNTSQAAVKEILYSKNMSYYMVSDDLKHNY